ncbi:MAG: ABC transporter permease [Desulfobacula sp.]|uniref:ABC transporter permease n=1 Tax=Desulfobacula sp. TaxID=2593537 RepID=UPI0025C59E71|nr:ABC transporter permease [Desulfobacula sp.]MCD4718372.1 ABC transporter permease [Desulfobacula sp.]
MFDRLYSYKDLFFIFIWRELLIRYKQTTIGVLWALIQPLSMMFLFVLVFGVILNIETNGHPKVLFYYSGLVPWTFFSSSISASITSLIAHRNLITKIYFPRELIIFSRVMVFLADFMVSLSLLAILLMVYKIPLSLNMLWAIPLFFLLLLFTAAMGLMLAMINVYYRDVKLASGFLLRLWFFATPVFYSIDPLPIKIKLILFLNPLTYIVENLRRVLIEGRGVVIWQFSIETVFIVCFFIFCYRCFIYLERSFADVI